jgi:hypothetical protein
MTMTWQELEQLNEEQFDLYADYRISASRLEFLKEKNPNYENDLTLCVGFKNQELEVKTKKHLFEVALMKWGIENTKQKVLSDSEN